MAKLALTAGVVLAAAASCAAFGTARADTVSYFASFNLPYADSGSSATSVDLTGFTESGTLTSVGIELYAAVVNDGSVSNTTDTDVTLDPSNAYLQVTTSGPEGSLAPEIDPALVPLSGLDVPISSTATYSLDPLTYDATTSLTGDLSAFETSDVSFDVTSIAHVPLGITLATDPSAGFDGSAILTVTYTFDPAGTFGGGVPEPSGLLLLPVAGAAMLVARSRRAARPLA